MIFPSGLSTREILMPLVNMRDMLKHAYRNGYAVGGFDLVSLDFLEAIMDAAEVKNSLSYR